MNKQKLNKYLSFAGSDRDLELMNRQITIETAIMFNRHLNTVFDLNDGKISNYYREK